MLCCVAYGWSLGCKINVSTTRKGNGGADGLAVAVKQEELIKGTDELN